MRKRVSFYSLISWNILSIHLNFFRVIVLILKVESFGVSEGSRLHIEVYFFFLIKILYVRKKTKY